MIKTMELKASVIMQDDMLLRLVKCAVEKMGGVVSQDFDAVGKSDFVLFDAYFCQLGLGNVLRKQYPDLPLILVAREGDVKTLGCGHRVDFYDAIIIKDQDTAKIREQISSWFTMHGGLIRRPVSSGAKP